MVGDPVPKPWASDRVRAGPTTVPAYTSRTRIRIPATIVATAT